MLGRATVGVAITWSRNTAGQLTTVVTVTTAAITPITVARATMAVDRLTRTTVTTRTGRIPIGVTEHPGDTIRTRTGAVIRPTPTTTTRTIHKLTAITRHWSQPCSGASANSVITTALWMESSAHEPAVPSWLLKAEMAWS